MGWAEGADGHNEGNFKTEEEIFGCRSDIMALQKHLARYRLLNLLVGIYSNIVCFKKKFLQGFFSLVILTKAVYKYTKFEKVELNYFFKAKLIKCLFSLLLSPYSVLGLFSSWYLHL